MKPKYFFYATLLDSYCYYLKNEWGNAEQELIDRMNRIQTIDPKALERMNRGTAFNEVIDARVLGDSQILSSGEYTFESELVEGITSKLHGSIPQYRTSSVIEVDGYEVEIYGVIDFILGDKVIDLKTTTAYDLGKYKDNMQKHVYPLCLASEGVYFKEFEFLATDLKSIWQEQYPIDLTESMEEVKRVCSGLIRFINWAGDKITDKKIKQYI